MEHTLWNRLVSNKRHSNATVHNEAPAHSRGRTSTAKYFQSLMFHLKNGPRLTQTCFCTCDTVHHHFGCFSQKMKIKRSDTVPDGSSHPWASHVHVRSFSVLKRYVQDCPPTSNTQATLVETVHFHIDRFSQVEVNKTEWHRSCNCSSLGAGGQPFKSDVRHTTLEIDASTKHHRLKEAGAHVPHPPPAPSPPCLAPSGIGLCASWEGRPPELVLQFGVSADEKTETELTYPNAAQEASREFVKRERSQTMHCVGEPKGRTTTPGSWQNGPSSLHRRSQWRCRCPLPRSTPETAVGVHIERPFGVTG